MPRSTPSDPVVLSKARKALLQKLLKDVNDYGVDVFDRLMRYLLEGTDEAILEDIARRSDAAACLGLMCGSSIGAMEPNLNWGTFLADIEPDAATFYLRLARTFEAAARGVPSDRFCCVPWFDNAFWLEVLLQEGTRRTWRSWSSRERKTGLTGPLIEAMLEADGRLVEKFVTAPFQSIPKSAETTHLRELVLGVSDLATTFTTHAEWIRPYLRQGNAESRRCAVENLARTGTPAGPFAEDLVRCAVDSSKQLREAAESLLRTIPEAARPHLEAAARSGKRAEREFAVRLLANVCGESARPFLETLASDEKPGPVAQAVATALQMLTPAPSAAAVRSAPRPPHRPLPLDEPLTPVVRALVQSVYDKHNEIARRHNAECAYPNPLRPGYPPRDLAFLDTEHVEETWLLLERGGALKNRFTKSLLLTLGRLPTSDNPILRLVQHADFRLIHLARLSAMLDLLAVPFPGWAGMHHYAIQWLEAFRRAHEPRCTLLEVAEAIRSIGLPDDILSSTVLQSWYRILDWEDDAVWPYFEERIEVLEEAFEPLSGDFMSRYQRQREFKNAMAILQKAPQVPPVMLGRLWDNAIGTNKEHRILAQQCLTKLPDLQDRLAQALQSGNYSNRLVAAEWLGRLGDRRAVAPLVAAAKKEKQDATLDEMLTALERLGEPIEPFLDRERLKADAAKGLKKGIPAAITWFDWAGLPSVHWNDTGKRVPPEVVTWLLVQSYKLKSAEAGPLLVRYCELMRTDERHELGRFVLSAWLGRESIRKHTDAEARALAHQQAMRYMGPTIASRPAFQKMEESLFLSLQRECFSAVAEKGLLAVAGACGGASVVPPVQKYLKEWYGYRAAQCKALIAMLSRVEHPSAIQYLLSISNRFRTKGIREEAEIYVKRLAERKGWTLDELGDRTLPAAGFDDDGTLTLSFGPRQFVARVSPDLEAVLTDDSGKVLKALPAPRKDDDEAQASAAKKAFSAARSELKKFAGAQSGRLYEAMCTQRTWSFDDWNTYLLGHPLMKFLCQRIVWAVVDDGRGAATFRPLDDGTFTNADDEAVTVPADARLRIAHSCQLPPAVGDAWVRHLADYEVAPLFVQFGRETWTLPDDQRTATAITGLEGHIVEAFKLRGMATKSGYSRGATGDGGWFYEYCKGFPGLGLTAVLEFSGNGLPEENRRVALTKLSFERAQAEATPWSTKEAAPLGEVPAVLLSECVNDVRAIAASGPGYDPEWEKHIR